MRIILLMSLFVLIPCISCIGDRLIIVQGNVSDLTGKPIEDAMVTVHPDCPVPINEDTDINGCFAFDSTASPYSRKDTIKIEKHGYKSLTVVVKSAKVADLSVSLAKLDQAEASKVVLKRLPFSQRSKCVEK